MDLQPWQERVVEEHNDVIEKRVKLGQFITSQAQHRTVSLDELARLERQSIAMRAYSDALGARIEAFTQ